MTNETYERLLEISNICIDYCNDILKIFDQKLLYEYANHDDVKRLFGLKTECDLEKENIEKWL